MESIQNLKVEHDSVVGIYVTPNVLRTEELCKE